ncbi:Sister chromatid cohesion protein 2 [Sorochytrium milnesiophthora]
MLIAILSLPIPSMTVPTPTVADQAHDDGATMTKTEVINAIRSVSLVDVYPTLPPLAMPPLNDQTTPGSQLPAMSPLAQAVYTDVEESLEPTIRQRAVQRQYQRQGRQHHGADIMEEIKLVVRTDPSETLEQVMADVFDLPAPESSTPTRSVPPSPATPRGDANGTPAPPRSTPQAALQAVEVVVPVTPKSGEKRPRRASNASDHSSQESHKRIKTDPSLSSKLLVTLEMCQSAVDSNNGATAAHPSFFESGKDVLLPTKALVAVLTNEFVMLLSRPGSHMFTPRRSRSSDPPEWLPSLTAVQSLCTRRLRQSCAISLRKQAGGEEDGAQGSDCTPSIALQHVTQALDAASLCILCIRVTSGRHKVMYDENTMQTLVDTVKHHVAESILPVYEDIQNMQDDPARCRVAVDVLQSSDFRKRWKQLVARASECLGQLAMLVLLEQDRNAVKLPEFVVITSVYTALSLLLSDIAGIDYHLRLQGMALVRAVFSGQPVQRTWILDQIIVSLVKMPTSARELRQYRLLDRKPIQVTSALLLQLLQCCAGNAVLSTTSKSNTASDIPVEALHQSTKSACDAATALSKYIWEFLLSKSIKQEKAKGRQAMSIEAEYVALLKNFFDDVLAVLYLPEFPAAEMSLRVLCQMLVSLMDSDNKKWSDATIRAFAIDVVGRVLCLLRRPLTGGAKELPGVELSNETSVESLHNLKSCQQQVLSHLKQRAADDPSLEAAVRHHLSEWTLEVSGRLLPDSGTLITNEQLRQAMLDLLNMYQQSGQAADLGATAERADALQSVELLGKRQPLAVAAEYMLSRMLKWIDAKEIQTRSRALKAFAALVDDDPAIMEMLLVQRAVQARLSDPSPSVRDAVLDIIGKYATRRAENLRPYHKVILGRVMDCALTVRKRALKLLLQTYPLLTSTKDKIAVVEAAFQRTTDEEDTMSDLATRSVKELLFFGDGKADSLAFARLEPALKQATSERCQVLCGVVAGATDVEPLMRFVRKTMTEKLYAADGRLYCEALMDRLMSETEVGINDEAVQTLQTLDLLAQALPEALVSHINVLRPMLDVAGQTLQASHAQLHILKILRCTLPLRETNSSKFLHELEVSLSRIIQTGGLANVYEAVAFLAMVTVKLSQQHGRIAKLSASCHKIAKDCQSKMQAREKPPVPEVHVRRVVAILGALCEHYDLDAHRNSDPQSFAALDADLANGRLTFVQSCFDILVFMVGHAHTEATQAIALHALGQLYRAHPSFLIHLKSNGLFSDILRSTQTGLKEAVLDVFGRFMASEDAKAADKHEQQALSDKGARFDRSAFMGVAQDFATAGVCEAVAQTYVKDIVACALTPNPSASGADRLVVLAQDIIGYIGANRLTHPKFIMPAIVALQGSRDAGVRSRAILQHKQLHNHHQSTIYDVNREAVLTAYRYQARVQATSAPSGYVVESGTGKRIAALEPLYSLIRNKAKDRRAFLYLLLRFFDVGTAVPGTEVVDVGLCHFLADNLALLEYKIEEEPLLVIYYANRVVSTLGLTAKSELSAIEEKSSRDAQYSEAALCGIAVANCILVSLKLHLKTAYSLKDNRCRAFRPTDTVKTNAKSVTIKETVWEKLADYDTTDTSACLALLGAYLDKDVCLFVEDEVAEEPSSAADAPTDTVVSTDRTLPEDNSSSSSEGEGEGEGDEEVVIVVSSKPAAKPSSTNTATGKRRVSAPASKAQSSRSSTATGNKRRRTAAVA